MRNLKPYILISVLALIAGAIYFINSNSARKAGTDQAVNVTPRDSSLSNGVTPENPSSSPKEEKKPGKFLSSQEKQNRYELAKEITTPDGFINTDGNPITLNGLIGKKVILVDFWTYSCINCQRTTPYLNSWYEKYQDQGFIIIGIHTPEFEFEKKYENVKTAVEKFGIKFPVVLDNDYSTWTAYKNQYWPRKYLIDIDGFIIYNHIGEGGYEETEKKIQELLEERMETLALTNGNEIPQDIVRPKNVAEVDFLKPRSPEIYFGASRNGNLGNGLKSQLGLQNLKAPQTIERDTLYLDGVWNFTQEYAENRSAEAKIIFRYTGKNVHFVARSDKGARAKILLDGTLPGDAKGEDVDINGYLNIKEDRLYDLIRGGNYGEHLLEIIIEDPGLQAFTFTFG